MPPSKTRKRKSKSAENSQTKKEEPVAKKSKIQPKRDESKESKPANNTKVPVTTRGRGRVKKETNSSETKTAVATSNSKSPTKSKKAENASSRKKPNQKPAITKVEKPKTKSAKKTAPKNATKPQAEQNGADESIVTITDKKTNGKEAINDKTSKATRKTAGSKTAGKSTQPTPVPAEKRTVRTKLDVMKEKPSKKVAPKATKSKAKTTAAKSPSKGKGDAKKAVAKQTKKSSKMSSSSGTPQTVYDFNVKNIEGEPVSLSKYKGSVLVIVNVASKCGLTSKNYAQLVELDEKYRDRGLKILAFPCNQFGSQEPGTPEQICSFVKKKNANFELFEKINVNGDDADPLWKFLKIKQPGTFANLIKWNFTKFLVDREGNPVDRFAPTTEPLSMCSKIESLL